MEIKEFNITNLKDYTFRNAKVSPVDLLAISTQIDFEKFTQTKELIEFALEHIEVKIGESWLPVKKKEVYFPTDIEDNLMALTELTMWYVENIIAAAFQKSSE